MTIPIWTEHEKFLTETFSCRVKSARWDQLQAIWSLVPYGPAPFTLEEALWRLDGLIERHVVEVHPPLYPVRPLLSLGPDDECPRDLRPYSELLRLRWNKRATRTAVFVASRTAANFFGSRAGGLPPREHRNHDLLLTDAFLHHLRTDPAATAQEWVGEQMLDKAGYRIKDPDAFKMRDDGTPYQVIESGGSYSASQLYALCDYSLERSLALEVW